LSGTRDAKTGKTKLKLHDISDHHLTDNLRWSAYKNSVKNGDVIAKMSTAIQKEIQTNIMYIKCLIDIVLYLGRQGIAFRGHREDETSVNKGT
jgi:hypothetical protein